MGLFNQYQKEGKGISKDQKTPRFVLFFQIYFLRFWNLIILNILYIIFCIPIVTIGPATAAMTKILRNYTRDEHAFLWGDFIETFKKNFKQAFLFSLIDLFISAFLILDLLCVQNVPNRILFTLSMAGILFTALVFTFMKFYIYNMMITFDLKIRHLLKNAFIFCWAAFLKNIIIAVLLIGISLLIYHLPVQAIVFIIITLYFSTMGYIINFMVNPTIKKFMMDGYDPKTGEKLEEEKYEGFENENEE